MREYNNRPGNREKKQARDRAYAASHREEALTRVKTYYEKNRERVKAYSRQRGRDRKAWAAELLGGKCFRCEQDHPAALDFHHRDPSQKLARISDMLYRSRKHTEEEIVAEIMKCDLLCKNCHAIEHYGD